MTTDNSVQNSAQNLARAGNVEDNHPISRIGPFIFTANGEPYEQKQLEKSAPFTHVQNILEKVTSSINSNVIDTLNTKLHQFPLYGKQMNNNENWY